MKNKKREEPNAVILTDCRRAVQQEKPKRCLFAVVNQIPNVPKKYSSQEKLNAQKKEMNLILQREDGRINKRGVIKVRRPKNSICPCVPDHRGRK